MKSRAPQVILALVALLAIFLFRYANRETPPAGDGETAAETFRPVPRGETPEFKPWVPPPAPARRETATVPLPEASEHAIPGEYTLFFEDESRLQAFIANTADSDISLLGVIPELLAIRVSGSPAALAPLLDSGMTVENNYRMRAPTIPDLALWQETNLRAFEAGALDFLDAPAAEDRLDWGAGVTIAVLDTGWLPHSGVAEERVKVLDLGGASLSDGELDGHGTAVVGFIGSEDPLAPGIAPGSDILAIRVLDEAGQGNAFTLAEGILRAVENGADVINLSLGGYGNSRVLREAVNFAISSGSVVVAASGNDGTGVPTYPAAYENVIGVTAVDANGNRAPFANYGAGIDVAAPGYRIHALWEDDSYVLFDGTSASAPIVSGMAARILQTGYAETPAEVQALLRELANDTGLPGDDPQYGAGLLNARRIEESRTPGIHDVALADLYPAVEESDGATFPLYVTFENRGTAFVPGASVEIFVNGSASYYRLTGLNPGGVESIRIPIDQSRVNAGHPYEIRAGVRIADRYTDAYPENNSGRIRLSVSPVE